MAAVISNQGGFYSTFAYVSEARRLGLTILPPDVNQSRIRWSGGGDSLRVGLMAIKGLSRKTRESLLAARQQRPFTCFDDFNRRVRPEDDEVRALIAAGAFQALHPRVESAHLLWRLAQSRQARTAARCKFLFTQKAAAAPPLPPGDEMERLRRQYAVLGFLVDRHPMVLFAKALRGQRLIKAADLPKRLGQRVRLAGWLITGKTVFTNKREPMQFLTFEDETGLVEAAFFPEAYRRLHMILDWERPYLLEGVVDENFGAATLTIGNVRKI
jgi:DNA polymerase-3 subunit alpha/error-prone DNA polymerase